MNFKSFRENTLKLTEEQFAQQYNLDISEVKKLDENGKPDIELILQICRNTGLSVDQVVSYEKPSIKPFEADYTWEKADFTKKSLLEYIKTSLDKIDVSETVREKYVDGLKLGIDSNLVKPSVAIVGRSDTGKSTLINSLLGMEKMPTSWTPTTSIAVYIKHLNDRPSFIEDDVWIFANQRNNENIWDVRKLYDEEYCKNWKIASGNIDILRTYGTRQGGGLSTEAGSAVVFVDAPMLLNCDIVDMPGFGTETKSDDEITLKVTQNADILVYLSQANGFMRIEDIEYLKANVKTLPVWEKKGENDILPLSNLFVVASQAHTVDHGNEIELNSILDKGVEFFSKSLSKKYWGERQKSGYKYSEKEVRDRFFTYTTDIPKLCDGFLTQLKQIIEKLPLIIDENTKTFVRQYVENRKPNLIAEIDKYEKLVEDRDKYVKLLKNIEKTDLERIKNNDKAKKEIVDSISELRKESIDEFSNYYSNIFAADVIKKKIKAKKIKNRKDDIECFISSLQSELEDECINILNNKAEILSQKIKKYIDQYSDDIKTTFEKSNVNVDFDVKFTFASVLSKMGIIGGLGSYVVSELSKVYMISRALQTGKYIMNIFKFGNIALTVVLGIIAAFGLGELIKSLWENSVSKKIVNAYEEQKVADKIRKAIKDYWGETEDAFKKSTDELDEKWNQYVDELKSTVKEYDVDKIQYSIAELRGIENFFDHIPLS